MRKCTPYLILILALAMLCFSFYGDDSYSKLLSLKDSLRVQKAHNTKLRDYIDELKGDVVGLQTNDRALEKAARNELGMARQDELVFFFEKAHKQPPE